MGPGVCFTRRIADEFELLLYWSDGRQAVVDFS